MEIFAFDVDGTLSYRGSPLTDLDIRCLCAAARRGDAIVLASGRSVGTLVDRLKPIQPKDNLFAIGANGARIADFEGNTIFAAGLAGAAYDQLYRRYASPEVEVYAFIGDQLGYLAYGPGVDFETQTGRMRARNLREEPLDPLERLDKVIVMAAPDRSAQLERELGDDLKSRYGILRSSPYFLEFVDLQVDKAFALERLAKALGVEREDVHTFGDSLNDLRMIATFDGTAMGNALDEVKAAANRICPDVWEDGVGQTLRDHFKLLD